MKGFATVTALLGALLVTAPPVAAQVWQGVVIGQSGSDSPRAFADSYHVANALKAGGVADVVLLRDAPNSDAAAVIEALTGAERALVYLTGPLTAGGSAIRLSDGPLSFETVVTQLSQAGIGEIALLIEACPAQGETVMFPAPPEGVRMLRAASMPPGAACPDAGSDTPRMTDLLIQQLNNPATLADLLGPVWMSSDLTTPVTLNPAAPPPQPAPEIVSDVSIIQSDVVTLAPVSPTSAGAATITQVSLEQPTAAPASGEVVIFAPTPQAQLAALPTAAGLPEPSIIVGLIEPQDDTLFEQAETPSEVVSTEIAYDNFEARRAMRAQDPEQFATLVGAGAFDPPERLLPAALQTELSRMGCYTSSIDGVWGRGSRRSVERYFGEIEGVSAVSLDPTNDLFRQIMLQDDVKCPVVAAATPRSTRSTSNSSSRSTTTRSNTTRSTTTRRAATPKPAAKSGRKISNSNSLGVFR